ncbi:2-oxoacid dehydrogenase/acyltransferase catalytic subunit [Kribbella sp. VKM Ac-2571]|uniref:2-oxo acid dehydrogenase subunit E2 n=1 Tax=Kribbella sp. VKM Ac-2571 TaxID=2512222 RepID=UPI00105CF663|nr:2-oxo acid dehydrogenase subunit E2 [Kribbella sp. VKM Ac-2571]TDO48316.1 2-oxoacid dehydrogenase/acyltransferase catalytic subunit [Kribbella sp. VKM Ac-2571]
MRTRPRRNDGQLVTDSPDERAVMPFIMRRRTESTVYFEQLVDVGAAQDWVGRWNAAGGPRLSLFVLVLHELAGMLHTRPRMNRFVSGRRLYQRDGVHLSFGAMKEFADNAPLEMIKRRFEPGESLATVIRDLDTAIHEARAGGVAEVDKELKLFLALPAPLLDVAVSLFHWLDARGVLPSALTRSDPLYSSAVVSNLGSLKTDAAFHHLYEHGNCPLFLVVGRVRPTPVADDDGQILVRPMLPLRWTFDERIEDGLYAARSAELLRSRLEEPVRSFGLPEDAVRRECGRTGTRQAT